MASQPQPQPDPLGAHRLHPQQFYPQPNTTQSNQRPTTQPHSPLQQRKTSVPVHFAFNTARRSFSQQGRRKPRPKPINTRPEDLSMPSKSMQAYRPALSITSPNTRAASATPDPDPLYRDLHQDLHLHQQNSRPNTPLPKPQIHTPTHIEISNFSAALQRPALLALLQPYRILGPIDFPAHARFTHPFRITVLFEGEGEAKRVVADLDGLEVGGREISVRVLDDSSAESDATSARSGSVSGSVRQQVNMGRSVSAGGSETNERSGKKIAQILGVEFPYPPMGVGGERRNVTV